MATLNAAPRSSTATQRKVLVLVARKAGYGVDAVRELVGGRLHDLSARQASEWIRRFSGRDLPNPPGQAPRPYRRKAGLSPGRGETKRGGSVRMIAAEHVEQLERLGVQYFDGDAEKFHVWLRKYHKVNDAQELATAARATNVIRVLKDMLTRKEAAQCSPIPF